MTTLPACVLGGRYVSITVILFKEIRKLGHHEDLPGSRRMTENILGPG